MKGNNHFDVIIIGGSYAGLAAGMALGRALRHVLIIDSGFPCNRQTPYSHNFLTQDGQAPGEISKTARRQVEIYETVTLVQGLVTTGVKTESGFRIQTEQGGKFTARKLLFATGIKDMMPDIPGFAECWGITALHCPYCHGYEVRNQPTGILGNGEYGFELATLISNWTTELALYTNGKSTLTLEQTEKLGKHNIRIVEDELEKLEQQNGILHQIVFKNGGRIPVSVLYSRRPFTQHCQIPESLGCELTGEGYIRVDSSQKTTVPGLYACGDNTTRMRTVANAVAMGTTAGMMLNKELIEETF